MTRQNAFNAKTVLITDHAGFKGAWLSDWRKQLGAKAVGITFDPPTELAYCEAWRGRDR